MSYTGSIPDTADRSMAWLATAPCKDDPDAMFPGGNDYDIEQAKAYCRMCPAIERCLQWALDTGEEYGVWGGLTEAERRQIQRQAARPISIDEYAGTRPARQQAISLQDAWDAHTMPDGEHLLWTGPKAVVQPRPHKQVTPNRLSFFLDRGRWPEGDTKRTCGREGCVKPSHLDDRTERAERIPESFQAALDAHTTRWHGGHLVWTGPRKPFVAGRERTPGQIAFIADRGRAPKGSVLTGCSEKGCVLPAHLSDQAERGAGLAKAAA
ncbi:WhiB family transcriptional regulator [Streptomyces griseorubiginosus]|uniref:WhiB family transcriptional regulator n=1 Tax=Streptomyces griseorubiginosus TaxID=67304 RepID=UPI0036E0A910